MILATQQDSIDDLCKATASALSKAYASGAISPVEVAKATLNRAEEINGQLNAFTVIDHEGAFQAAKNSEQRWKDNQPLSPVDGIPITIKDIVHCGMDTRYGSATTPDVSNFPDAPSVKLLRAAGVVMLGLTNSPEFGWKAVTDNPKFGITRNPWDTSKTPGGSSGGAAVAAATGAGALHLGTDGGGSIRIPASFTGIVGHKPSFGRVPAHPASAFGTVAHIGPMARTVGDTALMLNAMQGRDIRDWNQGFSPVDPVKPISIDLKGLRIGFWKDPSIGSNDAEVDALIKATVRDFELSGATVEQLSLPMEGELLDVFYRHWLVGAANRLSSIDKSDYEKLDPGFLQAAETGAQYSSVERMQAEISRSDYGVVMDQLLQKFDYIISPTVPIPAFDVGVNVPKGSDYESWVEWSTFSYPINLSQQPACSVPCGTTAAGMPVGLQIIGARGKDEAVLSAALTYEQMYPQRFMFPNGKWPNQANGTA